MNVMNIWPILQQAVFGVVHLVCLLLVLLARGTVHGQQAQDGLPVREFAESTTLDFFPVATQFSAVPCGEGWKGEPGPIPVEKIWAPAGLAAG